MLRGMKQLSCVLHVVSPRGRWMGQGSGCSRVPLKGSIRAAIRATIGV